MPTPLRFAALALALAALNTDARVPQRVKTAAFDLVNQQTGSLKKGSSHTQAKLKSDFGDLQFDGKRVRFRSKGSFEETNEAKELLRLAWDVDLDLPVVERNNAGR
jgi:hypothetical protein